MVTRIGFLRAFFNAIDKSHDLTGVWLVAGAALGLGIVSIFTFRLAEGFVFAISTMAACALVYGLGAFNKKWS